MTPALLDEVIAAHGGAGRWRELQALRARLHCGGLVMAARGQPLAFRDCDVVVSTREPWLVVSPFKGGRGCYRNDSVWIEHQGQIRRMRRQPRAHLESIGRGLVWDSLDALYVGADRLWRHLCMPFLLLQPGVELAELPPWVERGELRRRLAARFPAGFATDSPEQVLHLDEHGRIRRHDYVAGAVGRYAAIADYWDEQRDFGGLSLATRRRAYPRLASGCSARFPTLFWVDLSLVEPLALSPDSD